MFFFFSNAVSAFRDIGRQKKYVAKNIVPYLEQLEEKYQGTLPVQQKWKMLNYYAVLVPTILGIHFRKLYGQSFSEEDRWSTTITGLITPLFDDVFDIEKYDLASLEQLMLHPDTIEAQTFSTRILKGINSLLIKKAADPVAYQAASRSMFDSQVNSLRQFDKDVSREELEKITRSKGGDAFIFYHTHMMGMPSDAVKEIFYIIGELHQTCNDLFDVHKDLNDGVVTLANSCKDFTAFKKSFLEKIRIQNQKINALPYQPKDKKRFSLIMQSIEAKGLIAIDYFIKIENRDGKGIGWNRFSRKELVLDLETTGNYLKWMYNAWKISRMN